VDLLVERRTRWKDNQVLTELNVAQNAMTFSRMLGGSSVEMFGILALLDTVKTMGALSRLNLSKNKICTKESGEALALTLKMNSALKELDVSHNVNYMYIGNDVEQNFTKHPQEFVYAMCEGLSATKSLSKLIMTNNNIVGTDVAQTRAAGKALGDAIAVNATLDELDLSENCAFKVNCKGAEFALEFAVGLKKNARLMELNLVNCNLTNNGLDMAGTVQVSYTIVRYDSYSVRIAVLVSPAYYSSHQPLAGIADLADAIKTNETLASLHIGSNNIPKQNMLEIIQVAQNKSNIEILCAVPFKDQCSPELDVSRRCLFVEDMLVLQQYTNNNLSVSIKGLGRHIGWQVGACIGQCACYAIAGHVSMMAVNMFSDGAYLTMLATCALLYGIWMSWLCAMTPVLERAEIISYASGIRRSGLRTPGRRHAK
jgi:hypothetical protein